MTPEPHSDTPDEPTGRTGFAALVGRPNVGKSTLLNQVLGLKLAIVSHRPQTTRNRILGIHNSGDDQLIIVDTPGIHRSRANLNRFMVKEALDGLDGVDCVLMLTEVDRRRLANAGEGQPLSLTEEDCYVLDQVQRLRPGAPVVVVVNKVDRIPKAERHLLLPLMAGWAERGFSDIVPISALHGEGVEDLLSSVVARLPRGPRLYPEDLFTDRAERFLAAELIREQVFHRCHQEVPYATAVEVVRFDERPRTGDVAIEAIIHVERDSQKGILIGRKGSMIKQIGASARQEIGAILGCQVHLKLTIHVEREWTRSVEGRRRLGYDS